MADGLHKQYEEFVKKYIPDESVRPLLKEVLDDGNETDAHLYQIAEKLLLWEESLVGPLGLNRSDVEIINDIKKPELRR